jgi:phospholipase C
MVIGAPSRPVTQMAHWGRVHKIWVGLVATSLLVWAVAGVGPPAVAATGLEGIPAVSHIVVITLENEDASTTFAPDSPATYLNGLRAQGTFLPQYYGTSHLSLGNYITMVSGQPAGALSNADCTGVSLWTCAQQTLVHAGGRHLGDQLDEAGVTWRSYMDSTPTPCFHAPYVAGDASPDPYQGDSQTPPAKDYADRHNPFIYFPSFVGDDARCAQHQRPFTELAGDLAGGTLPQFSFITPDTCHDGHDATCSDGSPGGLVGSNLWLEEHVPALLTYLQANDGVLIVNFDEGDPVTFGQELCPTCAAGGLGGRTGAVVVGPSVNVGLTDGTGYDHNSLLRTIEDAFGVSEHLNLAANAAPMTAVFADTTSPVVPEARFASLLPVAAIALGVLALLAVRRRRPTGARGSRS